MNVAAAFGMTIGALVLWMIAIPVVYLLTPTLLWCFGL